MKKFVSIVLALCMVLTVCQTVVFAKDELGMIEDTRKAIKNNADSIEVVNDKRLYHMTKLNFPFPKRQTTASGTQQAKKTAVSLQTSQLPVTFTKDRKCTTSKFRSLQV